MREDVKTYAPIFDEVATSVVWRKYPFVYLDTTSIHQYAEHGCYLGKTTLVMQKGKDVLGQSDDEHKVHTYRKVLENDETLTVSLLTEFLDHADDGALEE